MKYYSTRDKNVSLSAAEAVKMGLSRDGGLLTPTRIPQIDLGLLERLIPMEYAQRAAKVMALYLTDYSEEELLTFGRNAYGPAQFDRSHCRAGAEGGGRPILSGAVARSHLRVQGHGAANAASAFVRRTAENWRKADGLYFSGHLRRYRQGGHGRLCRMCPRRVFRSTTPRTASLPCRSGRW